MELPHYEKLLAARKMSQFFEKPIQTFSYAISGILILYLIYHVLKAVFFSPLARIPNAHPLAPYTSLWILWHRYNGHEIDVVSAAHQHGPVVRLGPSEISVNSSDETLHKLHNTNVQKSPWYSFFSNYGIPNTMSSLDAKSHTARRRRVSYVYSKSWLQSSTHMRRVTKEILHSRLLPFLERISKKDQGLHEILQPNLALGVDFVNAYFFGLSCAPNFMENEAERDWWLKAYVLSHSHDSMFWSQEIPVVDTLLKTRTSLSSSKPAADMAKQDMHEWCLRLCDAADKTLENIDLEKNSDQGEYPEVFAHLKMAIAKQKQAGGLAISEEEERLEIASELLDHVVATRDAFGVTLSKAMYELSKSPETQKQLRAELRSISIRIHTSTDMRIPNPKDLDNLPLLNGVIKESLRLRPTHPEGQPRITTNKNGTQICGFTIPGCVRVNSYPFLLHRLPEVFPNCDKWHPERWLQLEDGNGQSQKDYTLQNSNFWAFGRGPRICLGSHLVIRLMQYILATIYTTYETKMVEASGFGGHGGFVSGAPHESLVLAFRKVDD